MTSQMPGWQPEDYGRQAGRANEALAREVFALLDAQDLDRFDKLVGKEYRADLPGGTGEVDWNANRLWLERYFNAFPDLRYQLNRIGSSGDSVFVEWSATGTHSGPFALLEGGALPATHRKVTFDGISIVRFQDDKLVHTRIIPDTLDLMRQLGVLPSTMTGAAQSAAPDQPA